MSKFLFFIILFFFESNLSAQQLIAVSSTANESAIQAVGNSSTGTGVYGQGGLSGITGFTNANGGYGVIGQTTFTNGAGVYGTGPKTGVYGLSGSPFGWGVKGEANGMSGRAVYGTTDQTTGTAIYGETTAAGASAVFGDAPGGFAIAGQSSGDGWAGSFAGGKGVYIEPRLGVNTASPEYPIQVGSFNGPPGNGAHVTTGGTWTNSSSKLLKEDFTAVDPQEILHRLNQMPITRWKYRNSDEGIHLGPMAEDFYAGFKLGNDDRYISALDADGVAFAAIQALSQKIDQQDRVIAEQQVAIGILTQLTISKRRQRKIMKGKQG